MRQTGIVLKTNKNIATLKIQRHSACASCGGCGMSKDKATMNVDALNKIGAKEGDFVEVDINAPNVLKAAMIVYTVPLIVLVGGTVLAMMLFSKINYTKNIEFISFLVGAGLTAVSYLIIKSKDNKFKDSNQFMPVITSIKNEPTK